MEADTKIVERGFFEIIRDEIIFPVLSSPIITLDSFLEDNRHLFTLIGVFGAISVYMKTVQENIESSLSSITDFGVFAGLSIVILLSSVVLMKIGVKIYRCGKWEGFGLIIFVSLFIPLILVISSIVSSFNQFLALYYFLVIYVLSLGTATMVFVGVTSPVKLLTQKLDTDLPILQLLLVIVFTLLIGNLPRIVGYPRLNLFSIVDITQGIAPDIWLELYAVLSVVFSTFVCIVLVLMISSVTILRMVGYLAEKASEWVQAVISRTRSE